MVKSCCICVTSMKNVLKLLLLILMVNAKGMFGETDRHEEGHNRHAVKTIESEDGDIIDCIDIYKQPAFDHPMLKNHTIQMRPSRHPTSHMRQLPSSHQVLQLWQKNGSCPEGTVPIRRETKKLDVSLLSYHTNSTTNQASTLERVMEYCSLGGYHGAKGSITLWNVPVVAHDASFSLILVAGTTNPKYKNGKFPDFLDNELYAGWTVFPDLYGDYRTRLLAAWRVDGAVKKGCYGACPGFVQTSRKHVLGGALAPLSVYAGKQYQLSVSIYRDSSNLRWWLSIDDDDVGYWPVENFQKFWDSDVIGWGGLVLNSGKGASATEMGNGHFPNEGLGRTGAILNALAIDDTGNFYAEKPTGALVSHQNCYDIRVLGTGTTYPGYDFLYGGPGAHNNPNCG